MPAGGYQRPRKPAAASGPGSSSRRTDGRVQPIREPDIDDPGLEYGDRKNLGDAQRIAGIANRPSQATPTRRPTGSVASAGKRLPDFLFNGESAFPNEPGSAGLDMGPGPGADSLVASQPAPDEREEILQAMVAKWNSPQAKAMLLDLRNQRNSLTEAQASAPAPAGALQDPFADPNLAPETEPQIAPEDAPPPLPMNDVPLPEAEPSADSPA
jgi:hypothetical protein